MFSTSPEEVGLGFPQLMVRIAFIPIVAGVVVVVVLETQRRLHRWATGERGTVAGVQARLLTSIPDELSGTVLGLGVVLAFFAWTADIRQTFDRVLLGIVTFLVVACLFMTGAVWRRHFSRTPETIMSGYLDDVTDEGGRSILSRLLNTPFKTYELQDFLRRRMSQEDIVMVFVFFVIRNVWIRIRGFLVYLLIAATIAFALLSPFLVADSIATSLRGDRSVTVGLPGGLPLFTFQHVEVRAADGTGFPGAGCMVLLGSSEGELILWDPAGKRIWRVNSQNVLLRHPCS